MNRAQKILAVKIAAVLVVLVALIMSWGYLADALV